MEDGKEKNGQSRKGGLTKKNLLGPNAHSGAAQVGLEGDVPGENVELNMTLGSAKSY
ncbi:hypothetical protein HCBG_03590 [Histoplasma capsulatum G186AR]|uniref:Uncharacterized protein n=1 Tax=Ajellomyces capsulatus (strain G186AR / H82 / ATCC MYA-2454 / RMSCC 2432) TaxID=447093 RepID=C0NKB0_AJECG|nr:uncharacterized protein HCBG_03590 [Histoplasma capsulatum G186AR]EEH08301.1 hypothetical protein HCBG_03590 [Histoplasma capsulatum G186AR]